MLVETIICNTAYSWTEASCGATGEAEKPSIRDTLPLRAVGYLHNHKGFY